METKTLLLAGRADAGRRVRWCDCCCSSIHGLRSSYAFSLGPFCSSLSIFRSSAVSELPEIERASGWRILGEVDGRSFRTLVTAFLSPTTTRMMPCLFGLWRGLVRGRGRVVRVRGKAFFLVLRRLNADWGRAMMLVCGRLIFGGGKVCNNNNNNRLFSMQKVFF